MMQAENNTNIYFDGMEYEDIEMVWTTINGRTALGIQIDRKEQLFIFSENIIKEFKAHILNFKPSYKP